MITQKFVEDKNYDDVFLRNVIVGYLGFLNERFFWYNKTSEGPVKVQLPFYYSLTGDNRYLNDAFLDDTPGTRIEGNTDQIPRGVISLASWAVKNDEFTNPNVWLNLNQEIDGELQQIVTQTKAVPIKLTFELTTVCDSELDIMKGWQTYMQNKYQYRYFTFAYKRLPLNAVFNFGGDTENSTVREVKFGDLSTYQTKYTIEVHTFFPIFDLEQTFLANKAVQWILRIWQNTNNPNTPLNG
jgi:hypothetical protein